MKSKISHVDIAGTVVLYNSSLKIVDNIGTYINQIEKLYVVDNSTNINNELLKVLETFEKVHYHSFDENKGIAVALNWAAKRAAQDGFSILLTMDDDTQTPDGMVAQMIDFWNQFPKPIGILSGVHHTKPDKTVFRELPYTLTSGNLLSLIAYKAVGDFCDDMFIDHVDHEYGLRLNIEGYVVVEIPSIRLGHRLGIRQVFKIGSFKLGKYGNHSPIRYYYFIRNGIYLIKKYPNKYKHVLWMFLKEVIKRFFKACLLDSQSKLRLKLMYKGAIDGIHGKLGRYSDID